MDSGNGPLTRYVKLLVAHAPGMPGTFSPPPISKETASYRSRHTSRHVCHARAVMHVGIANPRWRGKWSRHPRRMRNPQFYVSGKRPMATNYYMNRWRVNTGIKCKWSVTRNVWIKALILSMFTESTENFNLARLKMISCLSRCDDIIRCISQCFIFNLRQIFKF